MERMVLLFLLACLFVRLFVFYYTLTCRSTNSTSFCIISCLFIKVFAIRFKDSDLALAFKKAYEDAQEENKVHLEGADSEEGKAEADEAADAIAALSVTKKDETEAD